MKAKVISYNDAHETAASMGYPSLTEALEHLDELRTSPTAPADNARLVEAARAVVSQASRTYKARNGRVMSIEADDGEACWIVHSDDMTQLEGELDRLSALRANEREAEYACHHCDGRGCEPDDPREPCLRCNATGAEPKLRKLSEVRGEARRMALEAADEREKEGDPEGADCMRDLAKDIASIPLRRTHPNGAEREVQK